MPVLSIWEKYQRTSQFSQRTGEEPVVQGRLFDWFFNFWRTISCGPYTQLLPTSPFLKKRESHTTLVTTHSNRIPAHRHLTKCVLRETSSSHLRMMNRCIHGTTYQHQSIANIKSWMKAQKMGLAIPDSLGKKLIPNGAFNVYGFPRICGSCSQKENFHTF